MIYLGTVYSVRYHFCDLPNPRISLPYRTRVLVYNYH